MLRGIADELEKASMQAVPIVAPSKPRAPKGLPAYDQVFEEAWALYPKRSGHSKSEAWRQWLARVAEDVDPVAMLAGTKAYADYCERECIESKFVKHAATFYGRDRHFTADFAPVSSTPTTNNGSAAGLILSRIKQLAQKNQQPGQGVQWSIPRKAVSEMGSDVLDAYGAIGGADRILSTTGDKWGFLVREFDNCLKASRRGNHA